MPPAKAWPGQPYPLGATWDGKGVNFALFSAHAEKVELCLFDRSGQYEQSRIELPEYTDEVWHCYLPEMRPTSSMGTACTARTIPLPGTASIPTNCCSIPMRKRLQDRCGGATSFTAIGSAAPANDSHS